ncbi:putative immunity protein [Paramicrobacterium agarici]|uniref:Imm-5-like domain-containing protein n=1 Tax=Paramicrobacterium agarici TaxID=630514 RepID=A0A2A9DYG9_9MICO|nr:hypothetical protein [Microbacterium agarici]PFG31728.1 hypothetical protein ATJ78_2707 [Microbacterium agarici]
MTSIQTLTETDRRTIARWAAACAQRVLPLFEADSPDDRVQDAVARTRAFSNGESTAAAEIRQRLFAVKAARTATSPAGAAAARSAAQASAVAHMGAHALGAAAYAAKAVSLANPSERNAAQKEVQWQLAHLTNDERDVLRRLPLLGTDTSGPLGPGLLTRGIVGSVIREIQAHLNGGSPEPQLAGRIS